MATIVLILVSFAAGFYPGAQSSQQEADSDQAKVGDELFSIDLVKCEPLSKRIGWGLGYDSVEVKGKEKNRCVIRKVAAWEGDYTVSECRPKTSLKRLAVIKGPLYNIGFKPAIERSCKVVKKGHQFPAADPK
jgi:ribosomal protein S17